MAIFETVLKSDLKKPVQVKQLSGNLFSGDNQGNKITVEVMDNGSPATLTGVVTGYVIRDDNATVTILNGTLSGNKASIVLPEEAYNVVGRVSIVVKVGTVTVGACTSYVYKTSTDTLVDPTGAIPSIQELLAKISACEQATADANKIANLTVSAEAATGSTPDAVLSETGSPAHKHITFKLVKGEKGETGNTGATPQLSIGTVTTLPAGSDATASLTGTAAAPVLNLGIPKGPSGNETIDDTAGLGDTDLVYSADKVVKLFRSEHEDLTSGNAEQVIGKVASTEKGAYLYRRGMHLGNRCREKVIGGTVAWNQLVRNGDFAGGSNWDKNVASTSLTFSDNQVTIVSTAQSGGIYYGCGYKTGHKYLETITLKNTHSVVAGYAASDIPRMQINSAHDSFTTFARIISAAEWGVFAIYSNANTTENTIVAKNAMAIDLTQMFGSVIADTLYGMGEAGVAWFRERFSKDYYAYDAGSLQSVQAASKVIKDANNNTVHTYPFDTSLTLRGIPKLDSNNRLYYDGDEYESSGKVTRKYGIVDLGTLTWIYNSASGHERFIETTTIPNIKYKTDVSKHNNIICEIYPEATGGDVYNHIVNKSVGLNDIGQVVIYDSSAGTNAETFKTAMSGVYLVYELATPTTEQASPFTPIMSFDPAGTEEFTEWGTRDVAVPVGHITEYLTDPAKILNNIPLIEVEKESASVVTFSDGAEGLPLKELTISIELVQSGSGDPSPDNVRPISGWTGAKVMRTGENLFNIDTITHLKGIDENSGIANSSASCVSDYISVKGNTEYYLTCRDDGGSRRVGFYDKDKNPLPASSSAIGSRSFTTPSNAFYCRVSVSDTYSSETQVEFGSSGSTIAEYKGNEYPITFPASAGTVYGGTVKVEKDGTGKLVVDRAKCTQNDATNVQSLTALTNVTRIITNFPTGAKGDSSKKAYSISNYLPNIESYTSDTPHFYTGDTNFVAFYPGVMTGDQWRAYVAEHPLEIVYFIENPITIDLSPVEVTTLLGINNLWSDTGDCGCVYRADLKKHIDQRFAALEAAILALGE